MIYKRYIYWKGTESVDFCSLQDDSLSGRKECSSHSLAQ